MMTTLQLQTEINQELRELSLAELLLVREFIHKIPRPRTFEKADIMALAGAWEDMPQAEFDDFLDEIALRRQQSGKKRREDLESYID
ncbi:MAG: hypothetical protein R2880_12060 [Deinococcales bacterium]